MGMALGRCISMDSAFGRSSNTVISVSALSHVLHLRKCWQRKSDIGRICIAISRT